MAKRKKINRLTSVFYDGEARTLRWIVESQYTPNRIFEVRYTIDNGLYVGTYDSILAFIKDNTPFDIKVSYGAKRHLNFIAGRFNVK